MRHSGSIAAILVMLFAAVCSAQRPKPANLKVESSESGGGASSDAKQYIEVRTYQLASAEDEAALDAYLENALVPALSRQGLGPIGVLDQAEESDSVEVKVIIPGPTLDAVVMSNIRLSSDSQYQADAREYLDTPRKEAPLKRIKSELLLAFDCWPTVKVPEQASASKDRFFEMRSYQSSTEKLGNLKVEMFNEGEVPIFLDADIMPVFMGQALIGEQMPNLTYMVVFDDEAAMKEAWPNFIKHPDWKKLSSVQKYKGTVSKNIKSFWKPKSYSQL